ncbi:hypothetical protein ABGB17_24915 [Sphaerisporangium sp. B11E5]|uniref:hypothetical protein n=1 Tax=Sphaerisporangium sp. B11E5 TaxID=3153563 RepID=UPI00325F77C8
MIIIGPDGSRAPAAPLPAKSSAVSAATRATTPAAGRRWQKPTEDTRGHGRVPAVHEERR